MKFRQRHDSIAHERQQKLAQLLFLANLGIGICAASIMAYYGWSPEPTSFEVVLLVLLIGLSWLCLLTAAGALGWLVGLVGGLSAGPSPGDSAIDGKFLARHRMGFYYVGVIFNLLGFAVVAEVTGGVGESPFMALVIAFILTSQQLSRFRPQAAVMVVVGLAVTLLMLLFEPLASEPVTAPPQQLEIAAVLLALIGGGTLNFIEKPHNHYVRELESPSQVLVYRDAQGHWRFAFYRRSHRQDPILLTASGADGDTFPDGLEQQVIRCAAEMAAVDWDPSVPGWPEKFTTCFSLSLRTGVPR